MLRSDNGSKYKSNKSNIFFQNHGISMPIHHTSYPSTKWSLWKEEHDIDWGNPHYVLPFSLTKVLLGGNTTNYQLPSK